MRNKYNSFDLSWVAFKKITNTKAKYNLCGASFHLNTCYMAGPVVSTLMCIIVCEIDNIICLMYVKKLKLGEMK